jgi:hypothetical protein
LAPRRRTRADASQARRVAEPVTGATQMSKTTITRLFEAAIAAVVAGVVIGIAAVVAGLANGAFVLGGSQAVTLNSGALAWTIGMLVIASLVTAAGTVAAIASWVGALLNTSQLENKTWFAALLVLGLVSLGWLAMIAYVFAGPDRRTREVAW